MTNENKDILKILQELKEQKYEAVKPKQIKEIVPIEEWLEDPYYSGPDAVKLYPYWKKFLCELFKENSPYNEAILAGSIGTGKSTVAIYAMIRKLYEMSCFENLAGLYGLMKTSSIAMIYFSLSLQQAQATRLWTIKEFIRLYPLF